LPIDRSEQASIIADLASLIERLDAKPDACFVNVGDAGHDTPPYFPYEGALRPRKKVYTGDEVFLYETDEPHWSKNHIAPFFNQIAPELTEAKEQVTSWLRRVRAENLDDLYPNGSDKPQESNVASSPRKRGRPPAVDRFGDTIAWSGSPEHILLMAAMFVRARCIQEDQVDDFVGIFFPESAFPGQPFDPLRHPFAPKKHVKWTSSYSTLARTFARLEAQRILPGNYRRTLLFYLVDSEGRKFDPKQFAKSAETTQKGSSLPPEITHFLNATKNSAPG
jgi:hypothetical protein